MIAGSAGLGRTRLYTRWERRRRLTAAATAMLGAAAAVWVAAGILTWLSGRGFTLPHIHLRPVASGGDGGLLGLPRSGQQAAPSRPQLPVAITWPVPPLAAAGAAVPLWLAWLWLAVRPMLRGLHQQARHRGLAQPAAIRKALGSRTVRRAGRYTRPDLPWYQRTLAATREFGYFIGHPLTGGRRLRVAMWADFEQRIRILARVGWGKTDRLLVPIIRGLPGPAMISSTEPKIFERTVLARTCRPRTLRWPWLTRLARPWLPVREYPVAVVDMSAPEYRYAAGYRRIRWNPIEGCEDFNVAYRRAVALVAGVESESQGDRGNDRDQFFRDSAAEVLSAWLHAAALGDKEIEDLLGWKQKPTDPVPTRILKDHPRADPSAQDGLRTHLDPRAAATTSGVERYLALAMRSIGTADGRQLCGRRFDPDTGCRLPGFDMVGFLMAGGTVYLLADPNRIDRARPLLSLFAAEMFVAAETLALRSPRRRLEVPFVGVLDELRFAIVVPNLPYVASALRKAGIGYVYTVVGSSQEQALYGADAATLRDAAGVSIVGGIDIDSARELSERAGVTPVVTASRGGHEPHGEHIQLQDTLTVGDQQQLADGEATVLVRGLAPFLAWVPSIHDRRRIRRTVLREAATVAARVAAAREGEAVIHRSHATAAAAGADFTLDRKPIQ
ncbi:type IV secretory system conjugative DNA transfer family protein [Pseudonocardia kunmingensis]|uniref:Type IV secretory pathway TraG/TraD family ATPase VirD4 n=1 Tax=Pseudonocardia kunmingensis TaxID=630975 RepID=A0A543CXS6_9PSEU|nr:TraM recognition domain-containing protein [Pseudonocardia kunmingensis]TQM01668.1 type IV secretory pathway TraG/TraD family ATPase VirD4 [Pseudonocardia kunmingensis]